MPPPADFPQRLPQTEPSTSRSIELDHRSAHILPPIPARAQQAATSNDTGTFDAVEFPWQRLQHRGHFPSFFRANEIHRNQNP